MLAARGFAPITYFVPFANLVKPFQAMRELWQTSSNPGDWKSEHVPAVIGWWWLCWLAWSIIGNVSLKLSQHISTINDAILANAVSILDDALTVPLCLLLLHIMKYIQTKQIYLHAHQLVPAE
jgi:hypothetical protein